MSFSSRQASGSPGRQSIIFRPGGVQSGNVYTDVFSIQARVQEAQSLIDILVDLSLVSDTYLLPGGTYKFENVRLVGLRNPITGNAPTLQVDNGFTIPSTTSTLLFDNINIDKIAGASAAWTPASAPIIQGSQLQISVIGAGVGPFLDASGNSLAFIALNEGSALGVDGYNTFKIGASTVARIFLNDDAEIGANALVGTAGGQFRVEITGSGGVNTQANLNSATLTITRPFGEGTTAERPPYPYKGQLYYDTTLDRLITWDGVTWNVISKDLPFGIFAFGAQDLASTTATRYLTPNDRSIAAPTVIQQTIVPYTGVIVSMNIQIDTPSVDTDTITYTVMINGVASALAVTGAATSTSLSVTGSIAVVNGDKLAIRITKSNIVTPAVQDVSAILKINKT